MKVFTHPACLRHHAGAGHPESPARLEAVLARLENLSRVSLREAAPAGREDLRAVHPASYLDALERCAQAGGGRLDPDTVMNEWSWSAAQAAAGSAIAAVQSALHGAPAFAAIRPPGHHALAERAMGFCLLANAVIAVKAAQRAGCERVLIVDWDVHHGNGTQALVENDPAVRFVSLHQWPAYPGTGRAEERGVGNVFNVPMPAGLAPERYVEELWRHILTATEGWSPALVLVSAGFDGMRDDPLGGFTLEPGHYAELTRRLREHLPAAAFAGVLEGGYAPSRVAEAVVAHLTAV